MKFGPVPLTAAEGKILGHNIADSEGKRVLRKGTPLSQAALRILHELGRKSVYVAEIEEGDVTENDAALRIAKAAKGPGIWLSRALTGRVNLRASELGVFRVDSDRLCELNDRDGVTVACMAPNSVVRASQAVATVKVIPYALPDDRVRGAESLVRGEPLLSVDLLPPRRVALILSGSPSVRDSLFQGFSPLVERVRALGSEVEWRDYVTLEDEAGEVELAETLKDRVGQGAELVLLAGETAIMDASDITPRAVARAMGRIECVGAPVDPGNLLMLAYLDDVPVLGTPGCARSRKTNVVDWVLPRLLVGEVLRRRDIVGLGAGGLLEDVPERPLPRSRIDIDTGTHDS